MSRPSVSALLRGASARLSEGLPQAFLAALAAFVLVAILYTVAVRDSSEPRGFAEFTLTPTKCSLDVQRQVNATSCVLMSAGVYRVTFDRSLAGSTVVPGRGSCCPGPIGATIDTDKSVIVSVSRRVRRPIRASIVIP